MNGTDAILRAEHVSVEYAGARPTRAVRDVSFELRRGEVLGIAGESGSGKSTLAYALAKLLRPPARLSGGQILFTGADGTTRDMSALEGKALRSFRWNKVSMVFQSAMNALNPVTSIGSQFSDIFTAHAPEMDAAARDRRARELLAKVGIDPGRVCSFPHELSGGMRQRVVIAMALALEPELVIMDEPTTALDVVVQREILDEIERLREELGFTVIFITHDMSLLLEVSDRLAVMYAGQFVEYAPAERVATDPRHPYTKGCSGPSRTCAVRGVNCAASREARPTCGKTSRNARSRRAARRPSSRARRCPRTCEGCRKKTAGWPRAICMTPLTHRQPPRLPEARSPEVSHERA